MTSRYRLTSVETVEKEGTWVFTVRDQRDENTEVLLVPCTDDSGPEIEAWVNRCTHEAQELYREGVGAVIREGEIICPKHGSTFDSCSGYCDNGEAAETTLVSLEIEIETGQIYLVDESVQFLYEGPSSDDETHTSPSSTSHLQL
jgi:nitrite reductase/ring-hydroxylating ferredoxin subunit